jgi:hypothetical protein
MEGADSMARKPATPPGSPSQKKPPAGRAAQADHDAVTTGADDGAAKPRFDVTKFEGFIPIERLTNGWTLLDDDACFTTQPNEQCPEGKQWYPAEGGFVALSPDEERACATIARILYQVTQRQRAEKRARAEAEAIAVEPKFVRVRRASAAQRRRKGKAKAPRLSPEGLPVSAESSLR